METFCSQKRGFFHRAMVALTLRVRPGKGCCCKGNVFQHLAFKAVLPLHSEAVILPLSEKSKSMFGEKGSTEKMIDILFDSVS